MSFDLIAEAGTSDIDVNDSHQLKDVVVKTTNSELRGFVSVDEATGLLTVDDRAYQYLADAESASFEVEYFVTDGIDESSKVTATVTIDGKNDVPTPGIAVDDVYTEDDGVLTIDLTASFVDLDVSNTHNYTLSME